MSVPSLRFSGFPKEWAEKSGSDITSKITKGSSPNWQGFEYQKEGVLFITSENVRDGYLDISNPKYLPISFYNKQQNSQLQKGDLLINIVGASIGRSCLFLENVPASTNQAVALFRPNSDQLIAFVAYCYQQDRIQKIINGAQSESARPNLSLADLRALRFVIPTLPEQQKIADFLGAVDARVGLLRRRRDALRAYKKGMMQRLFSQTLRFTKPDGSSFPDWQEKRLGEVATINPKNATLPMSFQYIDLESVADGRLSATSTFKDYEAPERAQRIVHDSDILFQTVRPYQRNNLFFEHGENYVASTGYAQIRSKTNSRFLYQLLLTVRFVDQVLKRCTGTSYPAINSTDLAGIEINLPHPEEQQKIADTLTALDVKINAVTAQIDAMLRFKKGLLQQMFV